MAYNDLLLEEGINSQYLCVLTPKRVASGFTLVSGSVYQLAFDYGQVSKLTQNGVQLTEAFTTSLSAGQWYYDFTNAILYLRTSDSSNPSTKFIVATYELYLATFDAHWHRNPTDTSSRVVYYEPVINRAPTFRQTVSDTLFGFLPSQSSSIVINNAEHFLEKHIYDSSFNKASIKLYHWLDELTPANLKLVYDGLCSNVSLLESTVDIKTVDRVDIFDKEWRNPSADSYFTVATFPNLNTNNDLIPIRYVYGRVDGFVPVNIDYEDPATTSGNRTWVVMGEQANLNNISRTVAASPSSTATRTYVNNAAGFSIDDSVWLDRAVGTDEYVIVTNVNYGSNYIEHATLSGGAMSSGDLVKRSFVGNIHIIQEDVIYRPLYGRDYLESGALAGNTSGFVLTNNFEATLSMNTLQPTDIIACRVYGRNNDLTVGGIGAFGNDTETANLTSPPAILYDILKKLGITEAQINTASFTGLHSTNTEAIGFAIPDRVSGSFPDYKDLIIDLIKTGMIRLYVDGNNDWTISRLEPFSVEDSSIESDEILDNSFEYSFNYKELVSDILVKYNQQEQTDIVGQRDSVDRGLASSTTALYLHEASKQKSFDSLHFKEADAQTYANRLRYYYGDRLGEVRFKTKNRFFNTLIDDKIEITRDKMPGFAFDGENTFSRIFTVSDVDKNLKEVTITCDDIKGISDNAGSW